MRLGSEDQVDVELAESESFVVHALEEEAGERGIGDVQGRRGASTAGEEAVDDDRIRVALVREGLGVGWEDGPSRAFGGLGFVIAVVVTGVAANVVGTADGHAGGVTALDHHKALVVILVECSRVTHLLVRSGALEHQKTIARIREGMGVPWIWVHQTSLLA